MPSGIHVTESSSQKIKLIKTLSEILGQNCLFETSRASLFNWNFIASKEAATKSVLKIMTPNVTKALPDGWQNLNTINKAENWINERKADSNFYAISLKETSEIIGFLFLYNSEEEKNELRLGYLLSESVWGKGIGSELIQGLVKWSKDSAIIDSISGGVEKDNIGSIKVLEKNGFHQSNEELPGGMLLYKIDLNTK
jgi:ribosomal-protein-alanine N-acetyltransferase